MVKCILSSGLLAGMNQDSSHNDALGEEDVAIEGSLYTVLLDGGYRDHTVGLDVCDCIMYSRAGISFIVRTCSV